MEYAAKGLIVPLVGMRDNDFIFIRCATDPPQFFNLVSDHDDMRNLVDDQAFASQMLHLNRLVSAKRDLKRFDAEVGGRQALLHIVYAASRQAHYYSRDYQLLQLASESFMRKNVDLSILKRKSGF